MPAATKSVAVLGASTNPAKFGNQAVRAFIAKGYTVYPVNPRESEIEQLPCFACIDDVPERPTVISVYLPPAVLIDTLPAIAARGCDELILNPGTDTPEVLHQAELLGLNGIQACSLVALQTGRL